MKGEYPNIGPEIIALKAFISGKKPEVVGEILTKKEAVTRSRKGLRPPSRLLIKIQLEKLYTLIDMVGELVISRRRSYKARMS